MTDHEQQQPVEINEIMELADLENVATVSQPTLDVSIKLVSKHIAKLIVNHTELQKKLVTQPTEKDEKDVAEVEEIPEEREKITDKLKGIQWKIQTLSAKQRQLTNQLKARSQAAPARLSVNIKIGDESFVVPLPPSATQSSSSSSLSSSCSSQSLSLINVNVSRNSSSSETATSSLSSIAIPSTSSSALERQKLQNSSLPTLKPIPEHKLHSHTSSLTNGEPKPSPIQSQPFQSSLPNKEEKKVIPTIHPSQYMSKPTFLSALGLVTPQECVQFKKDLQKRKMLRKRRSTANPKYASYILNVAFNQLHPSRRNCKPITLESLTPYERNDVYKKMILMDSNRFNELLLRCFTCDVLGCNMQCATCKTKYHSDCVRIPSSKAHTPKILTLCPKCIHDRKSVEKKVKANLEAQATAVTRRARAILASKNRITRATAAEFPQLKKQLAPRRKASQIQISSAISRTTRLRQRILPVRTARLLPVKENKKMVDLKIEENQEKHTTPSDLIKWSDVSIEAKQATAEIKDNGIEAPQLATEENEIAQIPMDTTEDLQCAFKETEEKKDDARKSAKSTLSTAQKVISKKTKPVARAMRASIVKPEIVAKSKLPNGESNLNPVEELTQIVEKTPNGSDTAKKVETLTLEYNLRAFNTQANFEKEKLENSKILQGGSRTKKVNDVLENAQNAKPSENPLKVYKFGKTRNFERQTTPRNAVVNKCELDHDAGRHSYGRSRVRSSSLKSNATKPEKAVKNYSKVDNHFIASELRKTVNSFEEQETKLFKSTAEAAKKKIEDPKTVSVVDRSQSPDIVAFDSKLSAEKNLLNGGLKRPNGFTNAFFVKQNSNTTKSKKLEAGDRLAPKVNTLPAIDKKDATIVPEKKLEETVTPKEEGFNYGFSPSEESRSIQRKIMELEQYLRMTANESKTKAVENSVSPTSVDEKETVSEAFRNSAALIAFNMETLTPTTNGAESKITDGLKSDSGKSKKNVGKRISEKLSVAELQKFSQSMDEIFDVVCRGSDEDDKPSPEPLKNSVPKGSAEKISPDLTKSSSATEIPKETKSPDTSKVIPEKQKWNLGKSPIVSPEVKFLPTSYEGLSLVKPMISKGRTRSPKKITMRTIIPAFSTSPPVVAGALSKTSLPKCPSPSPELSSSSSLTSSEDFLTATISPITVSTTSALPNSTYSANVIKEGVAANKFNNSNLDDFFAKSGNSLFSQNNAISSRVDALRPDSGSTTFSPTKPTTSVTPSPTKPVGTQALSSAGNSPLKPFAVKSAPPKPVTPPETTTTPAIQKKRVIRKKSSKNIIQAPKVTPAVSPSISLCGSFGNGEVDLDGWKPKSDYCIRNVSISCETCRQKRLKGGDDPELNNGGCNGPKGSSNGLANLPPSCVTVMQTMKAMTAAAQSVLLSSTNQKEAFPEDLRSVTSTSPCSWPFQPNSDTELSLQRGDLDLSTEITSSPGKKRTRSRNVDWRPASPRHPDRFTAAQREELIDRNREIMREMIELKSTELDLDTCSSGGRSPSPSQLSNLSTPLSSLKSV